VLLVAIVAILAAVAGTYYYRNKNLAKQAPAPPKSLPVEVDAAASDWVWSSYRGKDPVVEVRAKSFRQVKERLELERVELRLHHRDAQKFDLVKSAKCRFDVGQGTLYSEGEVEITMGLPAEGTPRGRLVLICSSGLVASGWGVIQAGRYFDPGQQPATCHNWHGAGGAARTEKAILCVRHLSGRIMPFV
jgi:hypothetical protein